MFHCSCSHGLAQWQGNVPCSPQTQDVTNRLALWLSLCQNVCYIRGHQLNSHEVTQDIDSCPEASLEVRLGKLHHIEATHTLAVAIGVVCKL